MPYDNILQTIGNTPHIRINRLFGTTLNPDSPYTQWFVLVLGMILFDEQQQVIQELDVRHDSWRTSLTGHAIKRCCREATQQERINGNRRMRERMQHFAVIARKMAAVRWHVSEVRVLTPG